MSFRKSWKFYEECYKILNEEKNKDKLDPEYVHDVMLGYGVFNFIISLIPPAFTFFVEAIGFKGDREKGYSMIRECSKRQTMTGLVSLLILQALNQFYFEDYKKAIELQTEMTDRFPRAIMPLFISGYSYRFMGLLDDSAANFKRIYEEAGELGQVKYNCFYELGTTAVKISDWEGAIKNLLAYFEGNPQEGYRCYAAYEIGMCYVFVGNTKDAIEYFKKSVLWVRKEYAFDLFAARKSKLYLDEYNKNPQKNELVPKVELLLFELKEKMKCNLHEDSLKQLQRIKELGIKTLSPDSRAAYYLCKGETIRKIGHYDSALKPLNKAIKEKVRTELYAIPHALVEIAQCYVSLQQPNEAKKVLAQAQGFKDYDFNAQLLRTITRISDSINGAKF
uniref:Tetratricopeptide repeat protein n=1 Tax=Arcella intermedia TaxID=1963864 RepID=A0A6B2L585_9EUKA